jgi:CheY-like chemotaxis protein
LPLGQCRSLIFSHAQLIDGQGNVQVAADFVADRLFPRAARAASRHPDRWPLAHQKVVVGTVKEALDKQHFDLLFLDLKLPDGPAEDVYDPAKKTDPELPMIIITGYPDSEILDRILEKGPITVLKNRCKWTNCTRPCGFSAQRNRESGVTRSRFC